MKKNKLISSEAVRLLDTDYTKKKKRLLDTNEERKLNLEYPSSEPCGRAQVGVRLDLIEWGFWFTGPEKGEPW